MRYGITTRQQDYNNIPDQKPNSTYADNFQFQLVCALQVHHTQMMCPLKSFQGKQQVQLSQLFT